MWITRVQTHWTKLGTRREFQVLFASRRSEAPLVGTADVGGMDQDAFLVFEFEASPYPRERCFRTAPPQTICAGQRFIGCVKKRDETIAPLGSTAR